MEPQLFSCGLLTNSNNGTTPIIPSMEPQLFSCGLDLAQQMEDQNFRVALQWSRNFSVADCSRYQHWWFIHFHLQWSRNFSVADCRAGKSQPKIFKTFNGAATFQLRIVVGTNIDDSFIFTFNGAATFQLRIVEQANRNLKFLKPSMEPQLFSCGLVTPPHPQRGARQHLPSLQWSRNFSVADCV